MKTTNYAKRVDDMRRVLDERDKDHAERNWRRDYALVVGPWMLKNLVESLFVPALGTPKFVIENDFRRGETMLDGFLVRFDETERTYRLEWRA